MTPSLDQHLSAVRQTLQESAVFCHDKAASCRRNAFYATAGTVTVGLIAAALHLPLAFMVLFGGGLAGQVADNMIDGRRWAQRAAAEDAWAALSPPALLGFIEERNAPSGLARRARACITRLKEERSLHTLVGGALLGGIVVVAAGGFGVLPISAVLGVSSVVNGVRAWGCSLRERALEGALRTGSPEQLRVLVERAEPTCEGGQSTAAEQERQNGWRRVLNEPAPSASATDHPNPMDRTTDALLVAPPRRRSSSVEPETAALPSDAPSVPDPSDATPHRSLRM